MSKRVHANESKKLANLEPIQRDGQFGPSFRATIDEYVEGARGPWIESFVKVAEDKGKISLDPGTSVFIKCADRSWTIDAQKFFITSEYNCGPSINHAGERLDELISQLSGSHSKPVFAIAKLLGSGLFRQDSADRGQPCLVFQDAGVPTLEQVHLSKVRMPDLLEFAEALAQAVRIVHNQGIVHTFLVPRHLVSKDQGNSGLAVKWSLVGFGYARHSDSPQKDPAPPSDDSRDQLYLAPECRLRSKSNTPHTVFGYPADIYSIGAILYGLLIRILRDYGKVEGELYEDPAWSVLKAPPRDPSRLKRDIRYQLNRLTEDENPQGTEFLESNENILKILDSCLRHAPSDRFGNAEDLVEAIKIARTAQDVSEFDVGDDNGSYFSRLLQSATSKSYASERAIKNGHLEVATRERIVTSLCQLLAEAPRDSVYRTLTLPDYWTDANLGSNGRFLTMNRHMAKVHRLRIERLFLVSDMPFHMLPEETQRILESHLEASKGCEEYFVVKIRRDRNDEDSASFERDGKLVAYLSPSGMTDLSVPDSDRANKALCLNFFSLAHESRMNGTVRVLRQITKLRYWNPALVNRKTQFLDAVAQFDKEWKDAERLEAYISESSDGRFFEKRRAGTAIIQELIDGSKPARPRN